MYIYFDKNGIIKEVVNDVAIRRGSVNYNKLYVHIEDNPEIDDIWYIQKNPNGKLTNEVSFIDNVEYKTIPYDAKRDLTYFRDFETYKFYVFSLDTQYLKLSGLAIGTIRVSLDDTLWALGELTFNIQKNEINVDNNITQSQYDYLLLAYASRTLNEQTGSDLDDLLDEKIEAHSESILEPMFEEYKAEIDEEVEAQNTTIASLSQASPSVFDTASNITNLTENKGIAVATDTGYIYYWDSTLSTPAYVSSGIQYNSLADYVKHTGNQLKDNNGNNFYPNIDETKINNNTDDINNLLVKGKNIFDVANITTTSGKYLSIGNGNESTNSAYLYTNEYIPVKPSTTYYPNSWLKTNDTQYNLIILTCFYDIHKNFISGDSGANYSFTTPSNCYYIRFSCTIDAYNTRHIIISDTQLSSYVPYYSYLKKELIVEKIKLRVGASTDTDFKNLRKCLDSITDGSINRQYIIELEEGTYDFSSDITAEELADTTFKGIFVPDYTTIVGIGNVENTIIQLSLTTQNQYISTLNFKNTAGLENVTVKGTNTRYVIHDDFADGTVEKYYRVLKNVKLIGTTCYFSACYGCGGHSGMNAIFENCVFDGTNVLTLGGLGIPFLIHNNVEWTNASYFTFENCRFLTTKSLPDNVSASRGGLLLRTLAHAYNNVSKVANMFTYVTLKGNNVNGIVLKEENATYYGQGCMFKVNGYANANADYRNYATDGLDYSSYVDLI